MAYKPLVCEYTLMGDIFLGNIYGFMLFGVIMTAVRMRYARPRQAVLVHNGRWPSWPREGI